MRKNPVLRCDNLENLFAQYEEIKEKFNYSRQTWGPMPERFFVSATHIWHLIGLHAFSFQKKANQLDRHILFTRRDD
ncbi:hypothetical protein [Agrobacterium sp. rho-13.3]|uniref:hypothetical protein n=1 Tax=Agrobacterium sp. rho-13.3 TaxID=3072980 RepID=UPI002A24911C|nr:hypothetical protein [Agrobacterium sp. rho-13.3]